MADHTRLTDASIAWEEIPLKTIFHHDGNLWVKLSDRYISLVIPIDSDAWLLASTQAVEYQPSWEFSAITEVPCRLKANRIALLRSRAGPFLFWLIIGGLSSILSLLLLLRSLN